MESNLTTKPVTNYFTNCIQILFFLKTFFFEWKVSLPSFLSMPLSESIHFQPVCQSLSYVFCLPHFCEVCTYRSACTPHIEAAPFSSASSLPQGWVVRLCSFLQCQHILSALSSCGTLLTMFFAGAGMWRRAE